MGMSRSPPDPSTVRLPRVLPVFPLAGVLLLPRGRLPLNIFEPRYLAMVEDAMAGDRLIGMIQPADPQCRSRAPTLYPTGCAGRISQFERTDDGRFIIALTGVSRFTIHREVDGMRGYRRVEADWTRFDGDVQPPAPAGLDRKRLLDGLKCFFPLHGMQASWESLACAPEDLLITSLAMICPFEPCEKQALLEAPDAAERGKLLITLIEMAILDGHTGTVGADCAPRRH